MTVDPSDREINTAFTKHYGQRFADMPDKFFGVMEAHGVIVAIAQTGSHKAEMLRQFVTDEWHARIDTPKPGAS